MIEANCWPWESRQPPRPKSSNCPSRVDCSAKSADDAHWNGVGDSVGVADGGDVDG